MKKRGIRRVLAFALAMLLLFSSLPNGESLFGLIYEKITGENEQLTVKANDAASSGVIALELYKVDENGNPITTPCTISVYDKSDNLYRGDFVQDPGTNRYTWEDYSGNYNIGDVVVIRETVPPTGYQLSTLHSEMTYSYKYADYIRTGSCPRYTIGVLYTVEGTVYEGNISVVPSEYNTMWNIINEWLARDPNYGGGMHPYGVDGIDCGSSIAYIY